MSGHETQGDKQSAQASTRPLAPDDCGVNDA